MNSIPRLLLNPSWDTVASLSANELMELVMLGLMSLGLIGAVVFGIYAAFFRRDHHS